MTISHYCKTGEHVLCKSDICQCSCEHRKPVKAWAVYLPEHDSLALLLTLNQGQRCVQSVWKKKQDAVYHATKFDDQPARVVEIAIYLLPARAKTKTKKK
jgi:hypothetical protein